MIVCSNIRGLKPGRVFHSDLFYGQVDGEPVATNQPFRVIREATFAEYVVSHAGEFDTSKWTDAPWANYYEVSTD